MDESGVENSRNLTIPMMKKKKNSLFHFSSYKIIMIYKRLFEGTFNYNIFNSILHD